MFLLCRFVYILCLSKIENHFLCRAFILKIKNLEEYIVKSNLISIQCMCIYLDCIYLSFDNHSVSFKFLKGPGKCALTSGNENYQADMEKDTSSYHILNNNHQKILSVKRKGTFNLSCVMISDGLHC